MTSEQQGRRRATGRARRDQAPEAATVMTPGAFEEAQARLDEIIATLEEGRVPLAEALELHAEGARLYALLVQMLEEADLRVLRLRAGLPGAGSAGDGPAENRGAASPTTTSSFYLEALELEDDE